MKEPDHDTLAAYRTALAFGIVPAETIAALINRILAAQECLSDAQLLAADAHPDSPAELTSALTALSEGSDPHRASRLLMGIAVLRLEAFPHLAEDIARALYHLAVTAQAAPGTAGEMLGLGDSFDLANSGVHGSRVEAVQRLTAFLKRHALYPNA